MSTKHFQLALSNICISVHPLAYFAYTRVKTENSFRLDSPSICPLPRRNPNPTLNSFPGSPLFSFWSIYKMQRVCVCVCGVCVSCFDPEGEIRTGKVGWQSLLPFPFENPSSQSPGGVSIGSVSRERFFFTVVSVVRYR